jgi:hypothetical protein
MPYNCRDIQAIIKSDAFHQIGEEAFLEHLEGCPACRGLAELDRPIEDALRASLPHPAPAGITDTIMTAIRNQTPALDLGGITTGIAYALAPLLLIIAATLVYLNRVELSGAFISSADGLGEFLSWLRAIDIPWGQIYAGFAKAASSVMVLGVLVAGISLIWIYSITQLQEITK